MSIIERKNEFNERAILSIDSCLYTKLLSYYITKDNKKRIIDNMEKILSCFNKIENGIQFLSIEQKKEICEEIEKIYKTLISVSDKMSTLVKGNNKIKKIKTIRHYTNQVQILQHRCASILIKIGYKEKLETLDVYSILKIFIFEKKDYELVRMLFTKVPSLVYFEEMPQIVYKIFNKMMIHLFDDSEKYEYYKKMFEYLINLEHINVSKQQRKHLISKLEEKKIEIKNDKIDKHLIKDYIEKINKLILIIDKNQNNKLNKNVEDLNKKYDISVKFNETFLYQPINYNYQSSYVDLTDKYTISIDCKNTSIIDDAFSFEETDNSYILEVYVADLLPIIERDSYIDRCAKDRAFTINLPKNYVSMLPLNLVNNVLSLKQNQTRTVIVHRFEFSKSMDLISFDIYNGIIKVDKNYNYEMIDKIIRKGKNKEELEFFKKVFEFQEKLNSLNLFRNDYHEIKQIKRFLDSDFNSCEYTDDSVSSKLISSFMVLTNYFVSKKFESLELPFLYCTNKSTCNKDIIDKIKIEATDSTKVCEILKMINENYYSSKYSLRNEGHQGLGLDSYCHATNPIRNYASLTIQRLEQDFLFNENVDDLLIYAWEEYLTDLVKDLNDKKDKYKVYSSNYYKIYKSHK